MKTRAQIEHGRHHNAKQDRRTQRNVYGETFSFVSDVARQAANGQAEPPRQQQDTSDHHQQQSHSKQRFAKFNHEFAFQRGPDTIAIEFSTEAQAMPKKPGTDMNAETANPSMWIVAGFAILTGLLFA